MAIPAPVGSSLDDLTYTKAFVMTHSEAEISTLLSSAQNTYLKNLMALADHATVIYDTDLNQLSALSELNGIRTSNGLYMYFLADPATKTIYITIDYNSEKYGMTYYRIDSAVYEKVLEANFYLSGLIYTTKADANPTYTGFYVGDHLNYDKLTDLPITPLTSAQITTIDGLLQRSSWQNISSFTFTIGQTLNSAFVLKKDSTHFYIFSQVGSKSVVTLQTVDGGSQVYLIPGSALSDVLNALKTMK